MEFVRDCKQARYVAAAAGCMKSCVNEDSLWGQFFEARKIMVEGGWMFLLHLVVGGAAATRGCTPNC